MIRDNDSKYGTQLTLVAKASGIDILRTPFRTPRANAVCERFLKSARNECLDHMLMFGERHLYRVMNEYVRYFNRARPQQAIGQKIPESHVSVAEERSRGKIIAFPVLNDLHYDYRRAA